jgi:hypothetical protein
LIAITLSECRFSLMISPSAAAPPFIALDTPPITPPVPTSFLSPRMLYFRHYHPMLYFFRRSRHCDTGRSWPMIRHAATPSPGRRLSPLSPGQAFETLIFHIYFLRRHAIAPPIFSFTTASRSFSPFSHQMSSSLIITVQPAIADTITAAFISLSYFLRARDIFAAYATSCFDYAERQAIYCRRLADTIFFRLRRR